MFLIENVRDLIRHRGGKTLAALTARLGRPARRLRYHVEYQVYDAAAFGTPQARRRVLILGVRDGVGQQLPAPGPELTPLFTAVRHRGKVPSELRPFLEALLDPDDGALDRTAQELLRRLQVEHPPRGVPPAVAKRPRWIQLRRWKLPG